ncbi:polysaccharide deacetylase [Streptantibioticus cattleyicolor NRRL 8057 = DSM 46488]|uniref:Polysaccharide deacetylase n=1 Tax=Streptantibioticus cattleyicolor (strain ATCC 35852 / DSM 46488 / JCM 4925 / NBRC 14057 / NRRL 8057) TaxID=1003195 RepID=G8WT87_STREN|nr:polysaccharide deacetylase [Streptantibioticus cattleyicolor NRRL 8057 = DSM 46488]
MVTASAVAVVGAAALAGWWSAQAGEPSGNAAAPAVTGPASATPSAAPITGQTSVPDPALPAPKVNMDIAHATESGGKAVNITIDDGPDPVWTPKVLQILRDNGVKAVFCMIGPQAAAHPEVVKQVVADGHRLCDHTVSHNTAMDHRPDDYQRHQVLDAADQITQASGGVRPMYYRAPGGAFTPYSRQIAAAAGMRPLGWNVDSKDFQKPGVGAIERTVRKELRNGPTVLFHDGGGNRAQTVAALRDLLPWLKQQGYTFSFPVR